MTNKIKRKITEIKIKKPISEKQALEYLYNFKQNVVNYEENPQ